jgi:hypothetical protein
MQIEAWSSPLAAFGSSSWHLWTGVTAAGDVLTQEESLVQAIANYFQRSIPEVPFDDETKFVEVLKEAGLTDG